MSHYTNINGEVKGLVLIRDWALCSAVDCPLLIKFPAFYGIDIAPYLHVYDINTRLYNATSYHGLIPCLEGYYRPIPLHT